ncbi:bifunctional 2-polyprenyl-6-hydroxyphenol methylase/3-demethylubiquinol 3-O-methyltransferase UbiG [Kribbella sp. NBC_00662]|uniref:bifunctional 2-polyprenyl-6-hydroxyphenol methylase/3-demethylubiquinol 3-O-methyltransferase UbiG n=1 Tax=Kribbella sp. NBC_00662 TaxID=2975969 RepID=UPI003255D3D9
MPIDNAIYDRLGSGWWDESNPLNALNGSFTPARFTYFRDVLAQLGRNPAGLQAVDVGCGGGFLAEEFARLGCRVLGVDPSEVSIRTAQQHATAYGLKIGYAVNAGERLALKDESVDIAYCCDVLEHVTDLDQVIAETARVLKPGGVYLFDTINRTRASKLFFIKLLQEWRLTRMVDTGVHSWTMFIKPTELEEILRRHGLRLREVVGLGPRAGLASLGWNFVRVRLGRLSFGDASRLMDLGRVRRVDLSYLGYATKLSRRSGSGESRQG